MKSTNTISRSVEVGLHFIGIWPGTPFPGLHKFCWVTSFILMQPFQFRDTVLQLKSGNLSALMDNVSTTVPYSLLWFKLIIMWINHGTLRNILTTMTKDCQTSDAIDSSDVISRTANISNRLSNVIIGLYSGTVLVYAAGILASQEDTEDGPVPTREFFLKMELPFESKTSPVYEFVMTAQFFHQLASATSAGILNALLVMMILHVGCQIDIMCGTMSKITTEGGKELRILMLRHQEIIIFINNIQQIYTYIALLQFVSNTIIICSLGFLLMLALDMENGSATVMKTLMFYINISAEAFIFSYAGEYLSNKSRMIGDAAYQSPWYDLRPDESRTLLILILRSQKELTISIGKFTNLSLAIFATVMKTSASYVSVLLAMN